jgi:hypothetical protein
VRARSDGAARQAAVLVRDRVRDVAALFVALFVVVVVFLADAVFAVAAVFVVIAVFVVDADFAVFAAVAFAVDVLIAAGAVFAVDPAVGAEAITPPVASRPGTLSELSGKPATEPLALIGTAISGPTVVCDSPTPMIAM